VTHEPTIGTARDELYLWRRAWAKAELRKMFDERARLDKEIEDLRGWLVVDAAIGTAKRMGERDGL
jgi:hypothetical protein